MDDMPLSETRAARLCSWILFAAVSVCSAWTFLRVYTTQEMLRRVYSDLGIKPAIPFSGVTHPLFLWFIPAAVLIGFVKEIQIQNKTRTMVWNGIHLIMILMAYSIYEAGLTEPLRSLFGNFQAPKP